MSFILTAAMRYELQKEMDEGVLQEPGLAAIWMLLKSREHMAHALREIENCDGPGARKVAREALAHCGLLPPEGKE